jgi:succinate dehydrogenase/fumarate reductase flavoprotein subunit
MPEGHHVKRVLYRQLRRLGVKITNRFMATRVLTGPDGRAAGVIAVNTRTSDFLISPRTGSRPGSSAAGRRAHPA